MDSWEVYLLIFCISVYTGIITGLLNLIQSRMRNVKRREHIWKCKRSNSSRKVHLLSLYEKLLLLKIVLLFFLSSVSTSMHSHTTSNPDVVSVNSWYGKVKLSMPLNLVILIELTHFLDLYLRLYLQTIFPLIINQPAPWKITLHPLKLNFLHPFVLTS